MKSVLKFELKRAFDNTFFYAALLIMSGIAVAQFLMEVYPMRNSIINGCFTETPASVFNTCLMYKLANFFKNIYYYGAILMGSLVFASSYYTDIRGGYIKNICTRVNKRYYMAAKYIAVFLSAGCVCVLPLVLNIMLTMMFIPAILPQLGTATFTISEDNMLSALFYSHPMGYTAVYLLIDFLVVGAVSCIALTVTKYIYNKYIVMFIPFIFYMLTQAVFEYFGLERFGPYTIMDSSQVVTESPSYVIGAIAVGIVIPLVAFLIMGGRKKDVL